MTQFYSYEDPFGASGVFTVDLGNDRVRLGDIPGFVELAEHCSAGATTLTFDDPDADLGYAGDAIRGNARLGIDETACSTNRLYTGIFGVRQYRRRPGSSLILGSSREIECELHDLNALLSFRIIPQSDLDAIRPRESVEDRLAWIVGSSYLSTVHDNGLIVANATMMTKADYRGQRPVNVINDCEMAAGFGWNAFVYYDEPANQPSLFFDNANTSTAWSSTLRISNLLEDADAFNDPSATTFLPSMDAELRRDPTEIASGVFLPFKKGAVYRTSAATIDTYGRKDISAPNSNVGDRDRAEDQADDLLWQHHTEEDRITVSVELPPSHVNLIRAGHRIQVRFQHLPGYESFRWCRVLMRAPAQVHETDDRYTVRLELSPQEVPCNESELPTQVQYLYHTGGVNPALTPQWTAQYTLDDPTTIGNLLVMATTSPLNQGSQVVAAPDGWNWIVQNEPTDNAYTNVFWKVAEGEQTISVQYSDPDGQQLVAIVEYAGLANPSISGSVDLLDVAVAPGYDRVPAISYPAGAGIVLAITFMDDGPTGTDALTASGTGMVLDYAVAGGLHGAGDIGFAHMFRDVGDSSGATALYPAAGGWRFLFTSNGHDLTVGMAFEGGSCV